MWVEHAGLPWDELNRDGVREYRLELRLGEEDPEEPSALIGETFTSKAAAAEALMLKVLASRRLESEFEGMALNHVSSLAREGLGGIRCLKNMHADLARRVDDAERASRVRTRGSGVPAAPLAQLKTLKPIRAAIYDAIVAATTDAVASSITRMPYSAHIS